MAGLDRTLRGFDVAQEKVELEMLVVLNGTHHELDFRCAGLKRCRDQMKLEALHSMEARIHSVDQLLAHEQQHISDDYQASLDRTKEKVSSEIAEKIRIAELFRDGEKDIKVTTRSLRSKVKKTDETENDHGIDTELNNGLLGNIANVPSTSAPLLALNNSLGSLFNVRQRGLRRAMSPSSLILEKQLDNDQILSDIFEINRDEQLYPPVNKDVKNPSLVSSLPQRTKRNQQPNLSQPPNTKLQQQPKSQQQRENKQQSTTSNNHQHQNSIGPGKVVVDIKLGEVRIGNLIFYKSESVKVTFTDANKTKQQVIGIITSVNNSEVHLRVPDGSKHRIYLSHLRNGRSQLHHL